MRSVLRRQQAAIASVLMKSSDGRSGYETVLRQTCSAPRRHFGTSGLRVSFWSGSWPRRPLLLKQPRHTGDLLGRAEAGVGERRPWSSTATAAVDAAGSADPTTATAATAATDAATYGASYSRGWFQPSMILGDDT